MNEHTDPFIRRVTSDRIRAVYNVWRELAAGRIGPKRSELGPAKLRGAMTAAFVVEVIGGGEDFRVGFRGDRVMQFMGDACGATTLAHLRGAPFWDTAEALFRQAVACKKPVLSGPRRTQFAGKEHLEREVLLLPLSEDGVTVTALLGALDTWRLGTYPHAALPVVAD